MLTNPLNRTVSQLGETSELRETNELTSNSSNQVKKAISNILVNNIENSEKFLERISEFSNTLTEEELKSFKEIKNKFNNNWGNINITKHEENIINKLITNLLSCKTNISDLQRKIFWDIVLQKIEEVFYSDYSIDIESISLEWSLNDIEFEEYKRVALGAMEVKNTINDALKIFSKKINEKVNHIVKNILYWNTEKYSGHLIDYYKQIVSISNSFKRWEKWEINSIISKYFTYNALLIFTYKLYKSLKNKWVEIIFFELMSVLEVDTNIDFIYNLKHFEDNIYSSIKNISLKNNQIKSKLSEFEIAEYWNTLELPENIIDELSNINIVELRNQVIEKWLTRNSWHYIFDFWIFWIATAEWESKNTGEQAEIISGIKLIQKSTELIEIEKIKNRWAYWENIYLSESEMKLFTGGIHKNNTIHLNISSYGRLQLQSALLDISIIFPDIDIFEKLILYIMNENYDKQEENLESFFNSKITNTTKTPKINVAHEKYKEEYIPYNPKKKEEIIDNKSENLYSKQEIKEAWAKLLSANNSQIFNVLIKKLWNPIKWRWKWSHFIFKRLNSNKTFPFSRHLDIWKWSLTQYIKLSGVHIVELAKAL